MNQLIESSGFLKCAFAPNDFAAVNFEGVPDHSTGKVFSVHSTMVETIQIPAGDTIYLLMAPSPGVAYYTSPFLTGATADFKPKHYPDIAPIFGTGASAAIEVADFRFASLTSEATNVTPALEAGGSVKVMNLKLELADEIAGGSGAYLGRSIRGFPLTMEQDVYADKGQEGYYTVATNSEDEFLWNPVLGGDQYTNVTNIYFASSEADTTVASLFSGALGVNGPYLLRGLDTSFYSKLVEIKAPAQYAQTYILKNTACVEYRPNPDTLLSQISHGSPPHDPRQMNAYFTLAKRLPIAVPRSQNGKFWDFIKKTARSVSSALSNIPGPYGAIAGGVNQLIS